MGWASFAITDGTTRIELVHSGFGPRLDSWVPAFAKPKNGGIWQDSELSDNSRLVLRRFANAQETVNLKITGPTTNQAAEMLSDLERLLVQAQDYWLGEWPPNPVWIEAVAECETNKRYALLYSYDVDGGNNPYAQPFAHNPNVVIDALVLTLYRGHWQSTVPGEGECVEASRQQSHYFADAWSTNSDLMIAGVISDIIETPTGRLLTTETGAPNSFVWRTDDGGATPWDTSAAIADAIYCFAVDPATGYIYCLAAGHVYQSTDDGETWAAQTAAVGGVNNGLYYRANDGLLYMLNDADHKVYRSGDGAATWAAVSGALTVRGLLVCPNGDLYAIVDYTRVYRSTDGTTWVYRGTIPYRSGFLFWPGDGYLYSGGGTGGTIYRSADQGVNWEYNGNTTGAPYDMYYAPDEGILYAAANNHGLWGALPGGVGWTGIDQTGWAGCRAICESTLNNRIYSGLNEPAVGAHLRWSGPVVTADIGQEATCDDAVFLDNQSVPAQLTHGYVYDAAPAGWTSIFPAAAFPVSLLPAAPAVGDILYLGIIATAPNYGPFNNLVFDIGTAATTANAIWEYSKGGGAWGALTVTDGTNLLQNLGVCSVHWVPPADWASDAVNGVTGLWIRLRATGADTTPQQATRDIYIANDASAAIADTDVLGDIPALLRAWLTNRSDKDNANAPAAWADRYLLGLRSGSRGAYFKSFLNCSDVQIPLGLAIAGTAATVAAAHIQAPTGRQYTHTGTGTSTWATQMTFTLAGLLAASYYGRFRIFLRAQQTNGSAGDVKVRLQVTTAAGGQTVTGDAVAFAGNDDWQLLDLGSFLIPASSALKTTDLSATLTLVLQIWSSAARTVNLYDLALIPSDEWSGDYVDGALSTSSRCGAGYLLDVDSVSYPKVSKRAVMRNAGAEDGLVHALYTHITAGPAILQSNADQRLYVLCARYASGVWYSEPWLCHSVKLEAAFRYLSMRGSR